MTRANHDHYYEAQRTMQVEASVDVPTHSRLLGPDGRPLEYARPRMGFDLSPVTPSVPAPKRTVDVR